MRGDHLGGGRYCLLDELGRGGMGVVWLAEDSTIGRRVAIKELRLPDGIAPHERQVFEERVLREARTAGRLNDPGIVTVYDVVQEQGGMFIVMELVEYPDLADVVRQHGALSTSFVAKIAEQLLSALDAAHAAGVVHRDVKPANVMVAPNGRVKLTDFGIAQATDDPRLTQSGMLIGSPTYISPERLLGHDASPASDLWALGATLFFAVEGYGAYERPTTPASIQAILNERAQVRLAQGPLAEVIMGLLEPAPERRLNTTQTRQMIEQARALAGSTGEQLTTKSTMPQPAPPTGKSKRGMAIAAAVAVFVVAATVGILAMTGAFTSKSQDSGSNSAAGPATTQSSENTESSGDAPAPATESTLSPGVNTYDKPRAMQPSRTYGRGGEITAEDLVDHGRAGDCYNGPDLTEPVDDCAQPHDAEVFRQVPLDGETETWPGTAKVTADSEIGCGNEFGYVTTPNKERVMKLWALVPTEQAWQDNRRRALCVVAMADGAKLTGSVAGN